MITLQIENPREMTPTALPVIERGSDISDHGLTFDNGQKEKGSRVEERGRSCILYFWLRHCWGLDACAGTAPGPIVCLDRTRLWTAVTG